VFTKYDQYLYNVEMDVLDDPAKYQGCIVSEVAEERFFFFLESPFFSAIYLY